jgi:hypothetical protein
MNLAELKKKWQRDPEFQREYESLTPEFALARQMIAARGRAGLSQSALARRMKTTQSTGNARATSRRGDKPLSNFMPPRAGCVRGHERIEYGYGCGCGPSFGSDRRSSDRCVRR